MLYGHARRWGRLWRATRAHLGELSWRRLFAYSNVRREWRNEAPSWLLSDDADVACILREAQGHLWGRLPSRRVTEKRCGIIIGTHAAQPCAERDRTHPCRIRTRRDDVSVRMVPTTPTPPCTTFPNCATASASSFPATWSPSMWCSRARPGTVSIGTVIGNPSDHSPSTIRRAIRRSDFRSVHFNLTTGRRSPPDSESPVLSWACHLVIRRWGLHSAPTVGSIAFCVRRRALFGRTGDATVGVGNVFDNLRLHAVERNPRPALVRRPSGPRGRTRLARGAARERSGLVRGRSARAPRILPILGDRGVCRASELEAPTTRRSAASAS